MKKPVVAIPIGDIAGIGPEIVVKALAHPEIHDWCSPVVVGELGAIERVLPIVGSNLSIHCIDRVADIIDQVGTIDLIDMKNVDSRTIAFGQIQALAGKAAYEFIEKAVSLMKAGEAHAIATPPIHKEALKAANIQFIGHTEIIGAMLGVENPMTMFQVSTLKVFFLSRHLSLRQAIDYVTETHVYEYIHRCRKGLESLGVPNPRLVVAGLNPHSGEHGLFGCEEVDEIVPAIKHAQQDGINVTGPIGADSVFHLALEGKFDAAISLYHDQGHIATKMVDFEKTVSVTIGMPYVRTSVDHGTAFDIAGKNIASDVSMREAIKLAAAYALTYRPGSF